MECRWVSGSHPNPHGGRRMRYAGKVRSIMLDDSRIALDPCKPERYTSEGNSTKNLWSTSMTQLSRRSLVKLGAAAACEIGAAVSRASTVNVTSTEDWMAESADAELLIPEPTFALADLWWTEQRNVWTPIGWKDHYFRFNVLYNGTIICEPCPHFAPPRPHALRWQGQSFQLNFTPLASEPPRLPAEVAQLWRTDGGVGIQGWNNDHSTPVLWTEWRLQDGLVIRQEIFSHIAGAKSVVTAVEPQYAWVRLSVTHVDETTAAKSVSFAVQLSKVYYRHAEVYHWEDGITINIEPKSAPYPKELRAESFEQEGNTGLRLIEPDDKIRLVALPPASSRVAFSEVDFAKNVYALNIDLAGKVGEHVDLLVPFLPEARSLVAAEQLLGPKAALAESDAYWSITPAGAAAIHVPEDYINRVVRQNIKFAQVIAEKDYVNGDYTFLTGSWGYDNLWSATTSMTTHMFLDLLGYNQCVEQHIELFRKHQGSVKPPGPEYELHPGYFSTPKSLTAFNWLTDHGAILHQASTHALLSNDATFISAWTPAIVRACDFIKDSCAKPGPGGVEGLLPPAVATDDLIPTQAVYSLAWNYKGLTTAIKLLKRINHPRSTEFEVFAGEYKATFNKAFRGISALAPQWTDSAGTRHPKPPTTLSSTPMPQHSFSAAFYLDSGPMVLVWAGLLDAHDELMRSSVLYFREGPDVKLYGYRSNPLNRPVLIHEISSCEPCYSWNIFHSWQLGDRRYFLEGLYSLLAGSLSKQTYSACEHRHGIQSIQCSAYLAFYCARLSVIDDEIVPGELHLLRLCPQAWITSEEQSVFENMPTLHGTVNLRFRLSRDKQSLDVEFDAKWHDGAPKVIVHAPTIRELTHIAINGRRYTPKREIVL